MWSARLNVEARFARCVGERFDATVILEARAVERDLLDAGLLRALGNLFADGSRRRDVAGALQRAAQLLRERRRAYDDAIALGGDDLRVDVLRRAVHAEPMNAQQRYPHASAAGPTLTFRFLARSHDYFFFASLSSIRSFAYLTPLPLYGSGGR